MRNEDPGTRQECTEWLGFLYPGEFSELGANVALFLDRWQGLHHLNNTSLKKVDWSNETWIEFTYDLSMATVDNGDLTSLVVLAHAMMLRIDLRGIGPGYVKLMFHQRTSRDRADGINGWCPTIEEHVRLFDY